MAQRSEGPAPHVEGLEHWYNPVLAAA